MASIDYNDERFTEVEAQKQQALTENEQLYSGMIDQSDQFYQAQIDASKQWAEQQQQLQQEQTDFAIEKIEQEKEQAQKDYTKEQSGAYVDWQKESNRYGANAEQMAANGLSQTGYSESSQVSMYNTYQNRVATARESYQQAVVDYNNAIKDAQLQNNSALAEIAYNALQQQLELSLQGFQYKNTLLIAQADKATEIDNTYYSRYQNVVNQINTENALEEEIRQYNESMAYQKEQDERNYQLQLQQLAASSSSGSSGSSSYALSQDSGYAVDTAYYQGDLNPDAEVYGTFSNGYQPKGISGHGKLSDSGADYTFNTATLYGQKQTLTQNVWTAEDNTYWYWNGVENEYIQLYYDEKSGTFTTKKTESSSSAAKGNSFAVSVRL